MRKNIGFIQALILMNLKSNLALRGTFLLQAFFMIVNNLILFTVWWIFFQNFKEIRGWRLPDVAALYGVVTGSFGLAAVFGGGFIKLSRKINEGELDSYMTQPKNLLLHVLGSHSSVPAWGDLLACVLFFSFSGYASWSQLPLILLILLSGSILFLASGIVIHSLTFWMGAIESLARQIFEFVLIFSIYPQTAFSGWVKTAMFTIIPAGFIGYLPVELLKEFSWSKLLVIYLAAGLYLSFAVFVFYRGLRRYESGSRFGIRT